MLKEKIKGFIAGVCTTVLLAGAVTAFAANIDVVMGGIKIYWDGMEKTLTDVNGNKVEPMIYEGTTYVPLRAMANLMGKEVDWDQQNMAVIVGEKPIAESTAISEMKDKINYSHTELQLETKDKYTFSLKNDKYEVNNVLLGKEGHGYTTYVLDGKYTQFIGKAICPYTKIGSGGSTTLSFYSVTNNGDETLIKEYKLKQGEEVTDVDVNLTGVVNLRIRFYGSTSPAPLIYDAYFLSK